MHTAARWGWVITWSAVLLAGCGTSADEPSALGEGEIVTASCSGLTAAELNEGARKFLFAEKLGEPSEEKDVIADLISTRWVTVSVASSRVPTVKDSCIVVMNLALATKTEDGKVVIESSEPYEVIAVDPKTKAFSRFENAVDVPRRVQAAYGRDWGSPSADAFYYLDLEGPAVLDTWKVLAAGLEYPGFGAEVSAKLTTSEDGSVVAEPDGKAPNDPVANRTWKVKNGSFSLRRGKQSGEAFNVYPEQLDDDFAGVYENSHGLLAPRSASVRRWKLASSTDWNEVPAPTLAPAAP